MKWITASHLDSWAKTLVARSELPGLVADLIRATALEITAFRFPRGDKSQVRGFDGWLHATGVDPYVPDGLSFWEFGVGAGKSKALSDYEKRTNAVLEKERKSATLVLVSPATWDDQNNLLPDFVNDLRSKGEWADVRFLDGSQLEDWLHRCPAVAATYAAAVAGRPQVGARSTREFWDEYAHRFKTPLTEEVLLCGRSEQASQLLERLTLQSAGAIELAADSPDEAIAFAIAAVRKSDDAVRAYLEDRILILDEAEAARQFVDTQKLIYFPRAQADSLSGLLSTKGPTLIAKGRDQIGAKGNYLARPSTSEFAKSLETMGLAAKEAARLAHATNRSMTVLGRLYPAGNASIPQWRDSGASLIPALLAGSWDDSNQADCEAMRAVVAPTDYNELDRLLRHLSKLQDPPIDRVGSIWALRAPVDAFVHLAHLLSRADLDKLRNLAQLVFSSISRADLEDGRDDEVFLPSKLTKRYSTWLRDGIATTLLLVATLHEQADIQITGLDPQGWVNDIIANLPELDTDYRRISSLRGEFVTLIEAAPRPLLSALEHLLEGDGSNALGFFEGDEGLFSPTSPHTYILWGLECIAWDPRHLLQVSIILAKLAEIDPGGRTSNRPINSLRSIFLGWAPGTFASLGVRKNVIEELANNFPRVGWELLLLLLPRNSDSNISTDKPRFRDSGASQAEQLTKGMVREFFEFVINQVLSLANDDPSRWIEIAKRLEHWPKKKRQGAIEKLGEWMRSTGASRDAVWLALQEVYNRHCAFRDTDWAMSEDELSAIDGVLQQSAPADELARIAWLFDQWSPLMIGRYKENEEELARARNDALDSILSSADYAKLLRIVERSGEPATVAFAAAQNLHSFNEFAALLILALESGTAKSRQFAKVLSSSGREKFHADWENYIAELAKSDDWPEDVIVDLVLAWPDSANTWNFVARLGDKYSSIYWRSKYPLALSGDERANLEAIENYLRVGRADAALMAAHRIVGSLPTKIIVQMLEKYAARSIPDKNIPNSMVGYYIEHLFEELDRRPDIPGEEIAQLEYAFLPVFENRGRTLSIHRLMSTDPKFYFSLIQSVFPPVSDLGNEAQEPTAEQRAKWRVDYRLLLEFDKVPGTDNGTIDSFVLKEWVLAVRSLGSATDRSEITDTYIGQLLAHSPPSKDGIWPQPAICELIETIRSPALEKGIRTERFNMRGVYTKSLREGGAQERELADRYLEWAKSCADYPRVYNLLTTIAESWRLYAANEDTEAEANQLKG